MTVDLVHLTYFTTITPNDIQREEERAHESMILDPEEEDDKKSTGGICY